MIGEKDTAYGRRERCEAFSKIIAKLKQDNPGDFPVDMEFKPGIGHGGLPDRDKIKELYPYSRKTTPVRLTWELTDSVINDFFWISTANPAKGASIDATLRGNKADIKSKDLKDFALCIDSRLVDFSKPLTVALDGKTTEHAIRPSFLTLCQSILRRGDPELACTCEIRLPK